MCWTGLRGLRVRNTGWMIVEAVVFDFYGTLTEGRSEFAQSAARSAQAAALGVNAIEYDRVLSETYRERFRGSAGGVRESLAWVATQLGEGAGRGVVGSRGAGPNGNRAAVCGASPRCGVPAAATA